MCEPSKSHNRFNSHKEVNLIHRTRKRLFQQELSIEEKTNFRKTSRLQGKRELLQQTLLLLPEETVACIEKVCLSHSWWRTGARSTGYAKQSQPNENGWLKKIITAIISSANIW